MSYPKKLLRLRPTRGMASDLPANEVPNEFYTGCSNVNFRKGIAQRIGGYRAVYGTLPVDPVCRLQNLQVDTTNYWLVFGEDEIHALETSNSDEVTPSGGLTAIDQPHEWSTALLYGVPAATNGLDTPIYWAGDTGTPFADLPNFPAGTVCKSLVAFKNHLFALDIDGPSGHFYDQLLWSDAATPGTVPATWSASASNEAGDAVLGDVPGPLLCGAPLRGTLLIYKRRATYSAEYVGGNEVYAFRTLFANSGALNRHAVADINGQHFVVTDGDIILTDGTNRRSVAQGRMKDYLFDQLDQTYYENLFVVYYRAKNEVWVCFPTEGGDGTCDTALIYDVSNDAFGVRPLSSVTCAESGIVNDAASDETWDAADYTWASAGQRWNTPNYSLANESLVIGAGTAATMQDTSDSVSLAASLSRYGLTFGAPERLKFVKRAHVRGVSGNGVLYFRVGASMTPGGSVTWDAERTLTSPDQVVDCFAMGRYINAELRSEDADVWQISGLDLEADLRGYF